MNIRIKPVSGNAEPYLSQAGRFDAKLAFELLMKINGGTDVIGHLAEHNDEVQSNDLEFIHSTIDPLLGQLLEMVHAEQSRQEAQSESDEH